MKYFTLSLVAYFLSLQFSFSQSDTLVWDDELVLSIPNGVNLNPCNFFALSYIEQASVRDSAVYYRAVISQNSSWLCPSFRDEAEIELAFYVFSLTELWARKLNAYLKDNVMLPLDYRKAYLEDSWEKHLTYVNAELIRFGHGEDTTGLARDLAHVLLSIRASESLLEESQPTIFGYGMDFFASSAVPSNSVFSVPFGMGISLQFFARNTGMKLQGNLMYGETNVAPLGSRRLMHGQRLQHGDFSFQVEQRIVDNYYISIAPFAGYGYYEIQLLDSLGGSVQVAKSAVKISSFSPVVGLTFDYKLRGQLLNAERRYGQDSYWLVRAGISYTPWVDVEGDSVGFWGFKIGLGGFSKFWD